MENRVFTNSTQFKEEQDFDFQKIIGQLLHYWWLFAFLVLISLMSAFFYLRYSTPQFRITAKLLVKDSKKGTAPGMQMFEDLGLFGGQNSVDNEVELLKSRTLMENTVNTLQSNARFFAEGKIKKSEIFLLQLPFLLSVAQLNQDSISKTEDLLFTKVNDTEFKLTYKKQENVHRYGDSVSFDFGKMVFINLHQKNAETRPIHIIISRPDNTVAEFQQRLNVTLTSKSVSTIDLTFDDVVPARGELLLNTLIRIYNRMNTEDKNRVADSTIMFIDNRLFYVSRELGDVEKNIQQFRQKNALTNISEQGKLLLENSSDYFKELSKTEVQISIVRSLEAYLNNTQNTTRTIPAGLVIEDPTFASMIEKYNNLQLERGRQLQTTVETNPIVQKLDVQINSLKGDIIANLATIKRSMEITRTNLKNQTNSFESQIRQVPGKERAFLEISRQQAIKQELYLYLLKKREETAVSKAANIDNARVVDSAKAERVPFSPKRSLVYLSALLIGLVLPSGFVYGRHVLNNKVESKKDIAALSNVPVIAEIGRSPHATNLVIKENARHPLAEQFRLLRTNLDYMNKRGQVGRVIMVTSSMGGEGKSFISLNLAATLSLGGKKVLLLEFDLRKPKLSKYLGLDNKEGISSLLIAKIESADSLIRQVPGIDNLYMIGSGPIPPNPAELISGPETAPMFEELRKRFDHIIIDGAPVGVVSDALLLSVYADISIYVVRQHYTFKNQLEIVNELYNENRLQHVGIVLNDVKKQKGYGYGYGYGYGEY